ncbi:Hermansky-Pudlak syndrome 5 protein homolog [Papilio machaon]|uniref:Hermansky-Pudlak syndrome 5 protein homolog n=1 Tax=Papilio machaon TaxID=76193 RepID=UPI001E664BB9|nr:Hermansky-Pudlak syndrome 5 protein homolog [Papilio machaon]
MTCKLPPYVLQELPNITDVINYPLKNVHRIKFTCFDVSKSLIAFGATSGGIYVYNRSPCEFVQLIPNKDGPITRLTISSDEKHIGFANGKGMVTVTACDQTLSGGHSSTASKDHHGNEITAMVWSGNMLFTGDDVGRVSVLQLQSFITKTIFQSSSQIILSLDSRICQLDAKDCMLLVSTITRCYICNIIQEQYRQIGQKLRDGEFGACFVTKDKANVNGELESSQQDYTEVKKYNIVDGELGFTVGEQFSNTLIYCARPSSRLWEATVDGMVRRTHQFKQVLAKQPMKVITDSFDNENVPVESVDENSNGQSVIFSKLYSINGAIFSFNRHALYFLNVHNVDDTLWFDKYNDIVDCKIYHDLLYIWLSNGSLICTRFMKLHKFLVQCYLDEKYTLCADLCALYHDYLLTSNPSPKLHILVGLREKLDSNGLLDRIKDILEKLDALKLSEATQMKSGIYVVDNTYHAQTTLDEKCETNEDSYSIQPDPLLALKGLSNAVSDKFTVSKKILKDKWDDIEEKVKQFNSERQSIQETTKNFQEIIPRKIPDEELVTEYPLPLDQDIVFKDSSQKAIETDNNSLDNDRVCKSLYQYHRLSLVNKEMEKTNLISMIENNACDISKIYELMLSLERYCISVGALDESKFVPNNIFLTYLCISTNKCDLLDAIINDEVLYKYFVDSCILINIKSRKLSNVGCECGFPLPFARTNETPIFSDLIDEFIERQWSVQTKEQCYDICKKMPYLWRKILYLRRNEDLLNVLRILLQMLDESLLHSFLPQFTLDTWDRAIQLYAVLHANICLNCNKKFDHISVKDMLSWDDLGSLIIKSVRGKNAIELMKKHGHLIDLGALTIKFYHSCLLACLYEKYDVTIVSQLVDTIYNSYEFEESRLEICRLLKCTKTGEIKNTALPLTVAAMSDHWGLKPLRDRLLSIKKDENTITLQEILINMIELFKGVSDCSLCGLPLQNEVLIKDGGLWTFKCGHNFHGACLDLNKIKLCPSCSH